MDDRRRALSATLALLTCLVSSVALGQSSKPQEPEVDWLGRVDAALQRWQVDEAERLLQEHTEASDERMDVRRARLDLQRARYDQVIDRLGKRLSSSSSVSGELRVLLGAALDARGRRDEARVILDALADQYEDGSLGGPEAKLWLALSLVANDYPADANDIFREAVDEPGASARARVAWARLFRARYNHRDAAQLLEEALKALPGDPEALVELATVDVESDRDYAQATDRLKAVIAKAPKCVPAHNLLARIDLENERPEVAISRLTGTSLKVAPQDQQALALLATGHALLDDRPAFLKVERRVLALNPRAAAFYTTVSEHLSRMHRYAEAAALDERALALDERHWKAYTNLGIGRGRLGDDEGARRHLERAHEGDPYEVRTYNLLEHFYDKVSKEFEWLDAGPMQVRVHRRERLVLERVVPPLLREAYAHLSATYGHQVTPPLNIEIFPDREMFSVRSTGLPRLGAHGICFGHVITARSPSAGNFNWAEVLWHELSHVFHIQLSKSRVPRWFTEGLAIFEATDGRPGWMREMDETLYVYRDLGRLRGIADFNLAFTQARSMEDVLVAYYHAYLVALFIKEEYGREVMPKMLRAWGERRTTAQVFTEVLKVEDLQTFDEAFDGWLFQRFQERRPGMTLAPRLAARELETRQAALERSPKSLEALGAVAEAHLGRGQAEEALALIHRGLERQPSQQHLLLLRAVARLHLGELVGARQDLEGLLAGGMDGLEVRRLLGKIAVRQGQTDAAMEHLKRAIRYDPQQVPLYRSLIALLDRAGEAQEAHDWRRRLLTVDQGDPSLVMKLLGEAESRGARAEDVWRWAERGLHVAPFKAELHMRAAKELHRLGDRRKAGLLLDVVLASDPEHPGAKELESQVRPK